MARMSADEIVRLFNMDKKEYPGSVLFHKGAVIGVMNKACNGDENRRMVLKYLTGKTSSSLISDAEFYALYKLVMPCKPIGGHWGSARGDMELESMCGTLLAAAVRQAGQTEMFSETLPT